MIEFFMLFTSHMFYPIRKEILFTYIFIFVHSMSFYHNSKKKNIPTRDQGAQWSNNVFGSNKIGLNVKGGVSCKDRSWVKIFLSSAQGNAHYCHKKQLQSKIFKYTCTGYHVMFLFLKNTYHKNYFY